MLGRANKAYAGSQQQPRNNLAKALFPSSSPSASPGDIRDSFKKPSPRHNNSVPSARDDHPNPLAARSANVPPTTSTRSLASLYVRSESFKNEPEVVDLTNSNDKPRMNNDVFFAEDDFSDDENLDLDFKAPAALPTLTPNPPPRTKTDPVSIDLTQPTSQIPWSSSPASHFLPPKLQRAASDVPRQKSNSLKRESSDEIEILEQPPPKKSVKRVLPSSFKQEEPKRSQVSTPAPKRNVPWDTTASAIKEQKKQLKNQSRKVELPQDTIDTVEAYAAAAPISLSTEQQRVLDLVVNKGNSVFFTGPAGTGKSVLMRAIIKALHEKHRKNPERVAVTASTGLAACNINGITLHSFSGIGLGKEDVPTLVKKIRRNPKAKNRWLSTKILIIDEISMVDGELFDKLSQIGRQIRNNGRPWGGIQLVITGDFFQLPPVPDQKEGIKRESSFAFDAKTWETSIDHTIGLTQVFRQRDPEFAHMLNEMRLGKISDATDRAFKALSRPLKFDDGIDSAELYPTRMQVDNSNAKRLRDLPGKAVRFEAADGGDPNIRERLLANMMAPKSIDLKINAQVMLIKNMDDTLVNGSLGRVIAFSDEKTFEMTHPDDMSSEPDDAMAKARRKLQGYKNDSDGNKQQYPVVQFIGTSGIVRTILCLPEEWKVELPTGEVQASRSQLPLILAWSLSIHKAQGQTLERVTVNLGQVFEKGQAYVALSRATCQEGLRVIGFHKSKVMAHPRVVSFYDRLYSVDQIKVKKQPNMKEFIGNGPGGPTTKRPTIMATDDDEEAMASYGI